MAIVGTGTFAAGTDAVWVRGGRGIAVAGGGDFSINIHGDSGFDFYWDRFGGILATGLVGGITN